MSRRILYAIQKFALGLHTRPGENEHGDITASDMRDAQAHPNGYLIPRPAIATAKTLGALVEGMTVSRRGEENMLIYQKTGGVLGYLNNAITPTDLLTDADLLGRLSSDFVNKDVIVVLGEGHDQGYWLDLHNYPGALTGYPLGIERPDWSGATATGAIGTGSMAAPGFYYYRMTYFRNVNDLAGQTDNPFQGAESNPADRIIEVELTLGETEVVFASLPQSADNQVTRCRLYRSNVQASAVVGAAAQAALTYRVALEILDGTTTGIDLLADASIASNDTLHTDYDRLPKVSKSICHYNDRLFAACSTELRYSLILSTATDLLSAGASIYNAFPEVNAIRENVDALFCTNYRDMVLFGGPNGIWRLTGTSEFDFQVEQISTMGPIDAYAWKQTSRFVAFAGVNGLYITDGITVQSIHEPALYSLFQNIQIKKASVVCFPNDEILFNTYVDKSDGTIESRGFVKKQTGAWELWRGTNILQGDWLVTTSAVDGEKTMDVYIAEDARTELREILWDRDNITQDSDQNGNIDIVWYWQSQDLDWANEGLAQSYKTFDWLEILPSADYPITVTIWVDEAIVVNTFYGVTRNTTKPYRIPIRRKGFKIRFKLLMIGNVQIQYVAIRGKAR